MHDCDRWGQKIEVFAKLLKVQTFNECFTTNPIPSNGPGLLFVALSTAGREVPVISCSMASHDGVLSFGSIG